MQSSATIAGILTLDHRIPTSDLRLLTSDHGALVRESAIATSGGLFGGRRTVKSLS